MCKTIQFGFCFVVLLLILHDSLADTKVLHNIFISDDDSFRLEQISLKNADSPAEELVIDGTYNHYYKTNKGFEGPVLRLNYVADKNGYYAKYTYDNDPLRDSDKPVTTDKPKYPEGSFAFPPVEEDLNPSTLKSLGR